MATHKSSRSDPPPPGAGMDLQDAMVVADLFKRAGEANLNAKHRRGATQHLPDRQTVLMTGDLHDNGLNLQRIIKYAALHETRTRHLILHEIVHGPNFVNGRDVSIRTLARVAALKLQYPDQVHLLQANHELAQLLGDGIVKDGVNVVEAFDDGVDFIYHGAAGAVRTAMCDFIRTLLLAVRCPNRIICCHSVPSPRRLERFDDTVIERVPTEEDLKPRGSAYEMVWGRNHTPELSEELARRWNVDLFILGHQPSEMGYNIETRTMLVLASDHSHGMILPIRTSAPYDMDKLIESMVPLASVVL